MTRTRPFLLLGLLFLLAGPAAGQRNVKIPAADDTPLDILVKVTAPAAACMAVSDPLGLIAVGHHGTNAAAQVSLYKLGADGKPGEPVPLVLPRPAPLAKAGVEVLSVAFHPDNPLLYVWQDVELKRTPQNVPIPFTPAELAGVPTFDHLCVYRLDGPAPRLLVSLCRGEAFAVQKPVGSVCLDAANGRLYVPNLVGNPKNNQTIPGSYVTDTEGIPLVGPVEVEPARKAGPFNPAVAEASANAIATALAANKAVLPQRIVTPATGDVSPDLPHCGSGVGFVPVAKDVVLYGGYHDVAFVRWAPDDRRARFETFLPPVHGYQHHHVVAHPKLPVVYSITYRDSLLYRLEHADGHPTLAPQTGTLVNAYALSAPVVLAKRNALAFGGLHRVFLLSLAPDGKLLPQRSQVLVAPQPIEALGYSEKFDRLYVGVEPVKEKEKGK